MYRLFSSLAFFLCVLFSVSYPQTFWQQTNGPYEGDVRDISFTPSGTAYLATIRGIYRSTDYGANWQQTTMDSVQMLSVAVAKNGNIIAGGVENFVSTDNGITWRPPAYAVTMGFFRYFHALAMAPDGTIYAAADMLYKSTDNGLTFDTTNLQITYEGGIQSVCVNAQGHVFFGHNNGVYRSTTAGNSWEPIGAGMGSGTDDRMIIALAVNMTSGTLYAGSNSDKIYRSTDNGQTWTQIYHGDRGIQNYGLTVLPSGTLLAADYGYLLRTTNDGQNWDTLTLGYPRTFNRNMRLAPNAEIFLCASVGVFTSANSGTLWTPRSTGIAQTAVVGLAVNSSDHVFAATWANGVYRTTNRGQSWDKMAVPSTEIHSITIAPNNSVFVGTYTDWWHEGGMFRSTDNGGTWQRFELENMVVTATGCNSLGHIFGGSFGRIFRSLDNGSTWHVITENVPTIWCIRQSPTGVMYAGANGAIYNSTDNGATWIQTSWYSNEPQEIKNIIFTPQGTIYASGKGIYKSTNEGMTWTVMPAPDMFVFGLAFTKGGDLYCGTQYYGIMRFDPSANVWRPMNNGITNKTVQFNSFVLDSQGYLYAGSEERSVFRTRVTTTEAESFPPAEDGFQLMQNFPNPFNPATTIQYRIGRQKVTDNNQSAKTKLRIFDVLGSEIELLVDAFQQPGVYEVKWDASRMPGGIYFCELRAGEFTQTKKLILLK